tara:strand:- start:260 stop:643 length:384 start_codon:yes stop_codon:yes gene_type:complete
MAFKSTLIDSIGNLMVILFSGIVSLGLVIAVVLGGLFPAFTWLQKGVFPERDLLWLMSEPSCYYTDWVIKGLEGMDACRLDEIYVTDWVGVNKIINWFFDLQLLISWLVTCIILLGLFIAFRQIKDG